MTDSFDVDAEVYNGLEIVEISHEELDSAATKTVNEWQDNMLEAGYQTSGDTVNSITWEEDGENARVVGSDRMAALIGEVGRDPGAGHPPPDAIGDWVHEQAGLPNRGETVEWEFDGKVQEVTFDTVVYLIGRSINENGLPAHRFGWRAFQTVAKEFDADVVGRLQEAAEDESV